MFPCRCLTRCAFQALTETLFSRVKSSNKIMDHTKKQKMSRRPISTQSQGNSQVGVQVEVVQCSKSSSSPTVTKPGQGESAHLVDDSGKYSVSVEGFLGFLKHSKVAAITEGKNGSNEGKFCFATLVGYSGNQDLAILSVPGLTNTTYVNFGLQYTVGMNVHNISHPFGLDYSLTSGQITYPPDRTMREVDAGFRGRPDYEQGLGSKMLKSALKLIQIHNSHVKSGASGSPVFDALGNVIGIISFGIPPDHSFAIAASEVQQFVRSTTVLVQVSASLSRFIKGKGGSTQKQIEEETGTKIIFPSSKNQNSIVIEGFSSESITKASEKIRVILEEAVKSPNLDYSHFISLPLAIHPGLVEKLMNFQNSILGVSDSGKAENLSSESDEDASEGTNDTDQQLDGGSNFGIKLRDEKEQVEVDIRNIPTVSYPPKVSKSSNLSDSGIDKSIFIKPKTFHLTVLMLKLWNNERVTAATEVLQRISSKVMDELEGRPVSVRLKGLECMRGSLAKARVLYTPVEVIGGEDRLLRACQVITDAFVEAGLVLEKDAGQKLKLHGTVMNARHRKRKPKTKRFDSFDARSIVEQFGSEDWGEYIIPEVHLSQRFKFDENGYYHCCAAIPFPENNQAE